MKIAVKKFILLTLVFLPLGAEQEIDSEDDLQYRIQEVESRINKIRGYNEESKYLPELLYNLSYMYIEAGKFKKSKNILLELKSWERPSEVEEMMPGLLFLLVISFHQLNRFEDAINQADQWVLLYEERVDTEEEIEAAAEIYWYKASSYYHLAEDEESIQVATGKYRKAKIYYEHIVTNYQDSQFYRDLKSDINKAIELCKNRID